MKITFLMIAPDLVAIYRLLMSQTALELAANRDIDMLAFDILPGGAFCVPDISSLGDCAEYLYLLYPMQCVEQAESGAGQRPIVGDAERSAGALGYSSPTYCWCSA
jgi:hypothetical protein